MRHVLLAMTLLALLSSCQEETGTHIGNPTVSFALSVTSSHVSAGGAPTFTDDGGIVYTLGHARAYLRDIQLDLPDGVACSDVEAELSGGAVCQTEDSGPTITIGGPFAVDLLQATSTPDLSAVRLPALRYDRIDLRLDDGDPADGVIAPGDELEDRSFVARADFVYMETPAVLDLSLRFNEDLRIEAPGGVEVPADGRLLAELDAAVWLSGVRIGACLDDGDLVIEDGRLVIDDGSGQGGGCSDVENDVKDNIKRSGQLRAEASG